MASIIVEGSLNRLRQIRVLVFVLGQNYDDVFTDTITAADRH